MRYPRWLGVLLSVSAVCAATCWPARAAAHVDLRLGVKAVLNISAVVESDGPEASYALWYGSSPGAGFGGGMYAELQIARLLAIELDALFESNHLYFDGFVPSPDTRLQALVAVQQSLGFEQLRLPLLIKLAPHPTPNFEMSIGVGPELIAGLGASPRTSIWAGGSQYGATAVFGTAVAVDLGMAFYTMRFHIPISLRFSYNLLSHTTYADRVVASDVTRSYIADAVENWQLALVVGFGFLIPPQRPPAPPPPPPKPAGPEVDDPFYDPTPAQ